MIIKLLYWLLERKYKYLYDSIDYEIVSGWLLKQSMSSEFMQYFKWRDLLLLKSLGIAKNADEFKLLKGQRMELLYLLGKVSEVKEKAEKKKRTK